MKRIALLLAIVLSSLIHASDLFSEDPDWIYVLPSNWCIKNLISTDLNGDPVPDLVMGDPDTECIQTFLGNGDGSFELFQTLSLTHVQWLETADVDLDGDLDLIAYCAYIDSIHVMLNDGSGILSSPIASLLHDDAWGINFAVGIFDADTIPDIVLGGGTIWYSHGNGDGTFEAAEEIYDEPWGSSAQVLSDLDADGDNDIVLLPYGRISVLLNNGDGTVTWGGYYGPIAGGGGMDGHLAIDHLDSDSLLDVAVVAGEGMGTNGVFTFLGNGDGSFNVTGPGWVGGLSPFNQLIAKDFNLDDDNDVFMCGNGCVLLLLNDGSGMLIDPWEFCLGSSVSNQGAVGDFDLDGDFDFAYVRDTPYWWEIHVHLNKLIQQGIEESEGEYDSLELIASPSPFSTSLSITFTLPEPGYVELSVYDLAGRQIEVFSSGAVSAGAQVLVWNPGYTIPNGCYLIVLEASGERISRRCVKLD